MKLQLNYDKMGTRSKNEVWEWYTARVGNICHIHVHNRNYLWAYEMNVIHNFFSGGYDTKELAYKAAIKRLGVLLKAAMGELEEIE